MAGKACAVHSGAALAAEVGQIGAALGLSVRHQVALGKRIWGAKRIIDVVITDPHTKECLGIECKYQGTAGSAEEKVLSTLEDMTKWPMQGVLVFSGVGFSGAMRSLLLTRGAVEFCDLEVWLRYYFKRPVEATPSGPTPVAIEGSTRSGHTDCGSRRRDAMPVPSTNAAIPNQRYLVPQADSPERILAFLRAVAAGIRDAPHMASHLGFKERQSNYYREACQLLGLITWKVGEQYSLTPAGRNLADAASAQQRRLLASAMKRVPIMVLALEALGAADVPHGPERRQLLTRLVAERGCTQKGVIGGVTVSRRALTVSAWLAFIEVVAGPVVGGGPGSLG